ncbi:MAG: hypothetical protein B6D62_04535 [Candidatus Cloacimonas sp. 4484_275]|nr:MAG: hypothetical protein B6D62_04535 [Candidatus Cloacimonas sp. 4484_275]
MKKVVVIVIIVLLSISCVMQAKTGKNKKPLWLENPEKVYSPQIYLVAIGEGDSRKDAENNAVANLSRIFESKVKADETTTQRYLELTRNKTTTIEDEFNVETRVNVKSEQTLYNIKFADSYTDNLGKTYVLAYIKRMETAEIYTEKINNNAEKIHYFIDLSEKTNDIIKQYAALNAASTIAAVNETLIEQLNIISPTAKEFLELNYEYQKLKNQAAEKAKNITFSVKVSGSILFENTDLKRDDDFKFVRYTFDLKVVDNNGDTIISLFEKGKEGHTTYLEARERAIRKIGKKIKKKFRKKLTAYFDGLVM